MTGSPARSRSRIADGLPPITADKIVDAAVALTAAHGLDGWSIRQLAAVLEVWPRVIGHHVGDREAMIHAVTDRVVAQIPVPSEELGWREWFSDLLFAGRPILRRHRGVARRVVVIGPTVPSALPTIDRGIRVLQRDGFDQYATSIYRYLFNTAFMLVAAEDDRDDYPDARADMAAMLSAYRDDDAHPGLAAAGVQLAGQGLDDRGQARQAAEFYELTVHRSLDGAQALLDRQ